MSDEIVVAQEPEPATLVNSLNSDHHLVAVNGTEMLVARSGIQKWLRAKLDDIQSEIDTAQANYDQAIKHKWKASPFKNQIRKEQSKHLYYSKILAASEAGFTIVPNMDVTVFAVRTTRQLPKWHGNQGTSTYGYSAASPMVPDENEQRLPIGEGEYQSPSQKFREEYRKIPQIKDGKQIEVYHVRQICEGFDQIEFPLAIAQPMVMDATARAMAMKIFDRIGVVPRKYKRRGDPIVLGQITGKEGWQTKVASFLIAWYLDPRTL